MQALVRHSNADAYHRDRRSARTAAAKRTWALLVGLLAATPGTVFGQRGAAAGVGEGSFVVRDFKFASGETLPELTLHYRTLGSPKKDARGIVRNAVLIVHGTGGSGTQFLGAGFASELYGPGQLLDTASHFIILPDAIGHGGSSKPSDGMHAKFPHYTYDDMVRAQHRLLTEHLQVNHLRLVMGTSMGCMHSWVWGETYPDFMDGLVPLACIPTQIAGRNRMMRRMMMDDIRLDPEYRNGDYTTQPAGLKAALQLLFMMTSAPLVQQRQAPSRDAADSSIVNFLRSRFATTDANDMLYQFDSSREYDPSSRLGQITAPVLAINSADDQVNPPELGLMEQLMPKVAHGKYVLIPISEKTRGHGTHTLPAVWGSYLRDFLATLPQR